MQVGRIHAAMVALGTFMIVTPIAPADALAAAHTSSAAVQSNARAIKAGMTQAHSRYATGNRTVARYARGGISCVPFARDNTGIEVAGNAAQWWSNSEGVYQRGQRPEVGSVLNFRANGRMRMGHVAVVSRIIDARNIEIDHANWAGPGGGRGAVSRNVNVVDVSTNNDWTAVRVSLGRSGDYGSVYPTYGFIYDRPDSGTLVANTSRAPAPVLNTAPRDLRPASERVQFAAVQENEEVAEADDDTQPRARRVSHRTHAAAARTGTAKVTKTHVATTGQKARTTTTTHRART